MNRSVPLREASLCVLVKQLKMELIMEIFCTICSIALSPQYRLSLLYASSPSTGSRIFSEYLNGLKFERLDDGNYCLSSEEFHPKPTRIHTSDHSIETDMQPAYTEKCVDCPADFTMTVGEQTFYSERGIKDRNIYAIP